MPLDQDACYRALQARDARFDGRFFTAVRSTGIYCRPICPAPTPNRANCLFVTCAAAAQEAGFRPCLRCRPESSPGTPAWAGTSTTVARALRLIEEGALDTGSCEELASRLGIGERHLRRLFVDHVGASPQAIALTRRIAFAKQLIDGSDLKMAQVAFSAGFSSVRRFNDAVRATYGRSPRELRATRRRAPDEAIGPGPTPRGHARLSLRLAYRPPLDWQGLLSALGREAAEGVEVVTRDTYTRTFLFEDGKNDRNDGQSAPTAGRIRVRRSERRHELVAELEASRTGSLSRIAERLRRMFDLCADPSDIQAGLGHDPYLMPLLAQRPGVRIPGAWDPFELAVKTLALGPQPDEADRAGLASLVESAGTRAAIGASEPGEPGASPGSPTWPTTLFPTPEALSGVTAKATGLPSDRADAVVALAAGVVSRSLKPRRDPGGISAATIAQLREQPGIDEATVARIALRGLGQPDAFSSGDPALLAAFASASAADASPDTLEQAAVNWKPWRGYGVTLLLGSADG